MKFNLTCYAIVVLLLTGGVSCSKKKKNTPTPQPTTSMPAELSAFNNLTLYGQPHHAPDGVIDEIKSIDGNGDFNYLSYGMHLDIQGTKQVKEDAPSQSTTWYYNVKISLRSAPDTYYNGEIGNYKGYLSPGKKGEYYFLNITSTSSNGSKIFYSQEYESKH